jgi:O-antigen/teichoic acid export membrane protein
MAVLVLLGLASVRSFLVAMLVGNAVTWLIAFAAWNRKRGAAPAWRPELLRRIFAYGAKVQLGSWSAAANLRLDQLMLSSLGASASLGLYVVGLSYAGLLTMLPLVAGIVMLPRLVRACTIGAGGNTLAIWCRWVLWATAAAALCLWLMARAILPFLFGGAFTESVSLQALLIPSSSVLGMNQFLAIGFRGHGRPGVASRSEMVGLMITVPLLVVLLPKYGIYGAAFTSLCAYTLSGTYLLWRAGEIVHSRRALWLLNGEDWLIAKRSVRTLASALRLS